MVAGFQSGAFVDEHTAIRETIDVAIFTFPNEWPPSAGQIGTTVLEQLWRADYSKDAVITTIENELQRFENWFVVDAVDIMPVENRVDVIMTVTIVATQETFQYIRIV